MDKEIFFELASGFWINMSAYYFVQISVYWQSGTSSGIVISIVNFMVTSLLAYYSKIELKKML
jgi:hypothetical protein